MEKKIYIIIILFAFGLVVSSAFIFREALEIYSLADVPEEVYKANTIFLQEILGERNAVPKKRFLGDFDTWHIMDFSRVREYYYIEYKTDNGKIFYLVTDPATLNVIFYEGPPIGKYSVLEKFFNYREEEVFNLTLSLLDYLQLRKDKKLYSIKTSDENIYISGGMRFADLWPKETVERINIYGSSDNKEFSTDVLYNIPFEFYYNFNKKKMSFCCLFNKFWRLGYQDFYP
ncbi:MAG: hypothetical protein ACP5UA_04235 [Candidatus Hydrogenedens sp.]